MVGPRVPASGSRNAKLAFVGMAPARDEVAQGKPFVGFAGSVLNGALSSLGIAREDVFITNVLEYMIPVGSRVFEQPSHLIAAETARLKAELQSVRPNVVVPLGDEPLQVLTGKQGITKWRGSILESTLVPGLKCVPSVHPAWITRGMWKWRPIFTHVDLTRAIEESAYPEFRLPQRVYHTGPSLNFALDYLHEANKKEFVGFDFEVFFYSKVAPGHIVCIGVGWSATEALCIPLIRANGANYWSAQEEAKIWQAFAKLMQNENVGKIAQNAPFEWLYCWLHGIYPFPLLFDPMRMHHCLYPDFGGTQDPVPSDRDKKKKFEEPGHGLAFITSQYTREPYYKDDGKGWDPSHGETKLWRYNCTDVMVMIEAGLKLKKELEEEGLWDTYVETYVRPFYHALAIEWEGVAIDLEKREQARVELVGNPKLGIKGRINELTELINQAVGYELNVNSHVQMKRLLYEEKGYQAKTKLDKKTGQRKVTADKYALQYFADKKGDETLKLVLEQRKLRDLLGDIISQRLDESGRIHTHYKLGGTDGSRWSSTRSILGSGTNLQNVPRKGIARKLFIPG